MSFHRTLRSAALVSAWLVALAPGVGAAPPGVANIQRTMGRVARSTADDPAEVRVEFYGQSITAQPWTKLVGEDLAARFPSVRFTFHNPAIGGFDSSSLIRTAEHDLYPWYPDLLVFHVYGPVEQYEDIVREARARTTAEIVLWTSHLRAHETLDTDPDSDARIVAIRAIAARYDCLLVDARRGWIAHLRDNALEPDALLEDGVHLNQAGIELLASLVAPELVPVADLDTTPLAGTVTDIAVNDPAVTRDADGRLSLAFTGNRVVAISDGRGGGSARVLLDGAAMDPLPELWAVTRPSTAPDIWMPAIKRVSFRAAPIEEDWTLECLDDSTPDGKEIRFRVRGSRTGDDGEGISTRRFVSDSGRVVIEPEDWHLAWCLAHKGLALPRGFEITWKTRPLFTADYEARPAGTETVLVQNCALGAHTLSLDGTAEELGIAAFRVHAPAADSLPERVTLEAAAVAAAPAANPPAARPPAAKAAGSAESDPADKRSPAPTRRLPFGGRPKPPAKR